jgi:subtilisin family serine protease
MRRKSCLLVFLALVALFALPQIASAAKTARILVHFDKHAGAARQRALIGSVDGQRVATVHRLGTAIVSVPAAEKRQALALLRHQSGVNYAEADGAVHAYALSINDPYSISTLDSSPLWPLANPLFPDAWDLTTGDSSVIVAVVDSGVETGHPDLGTLTAGYDFVNNDSVPADDDGHGTAVAGVIAAQGKNGIGIAGVCWKCRIMPVKVLDSTGEGADSWVASGITWAVDHGADVINMSLGGTSTSQTLAEAVSYALEKGVVVVAAAGNDGEDAALATTPNYPAAYSGVISVGAVDASNSRYPWSNHGSWVQVDAPGLTNTTGLSSSYVGFEGTSAASPFVAGLAGLARSHNLPATSSSVTSAIEDTAQALVSGNSVHGLIDAPATLANISSAPPGPVASFTSSTVSGILPLAVSFTNTSTNATSYTWSFGDGTSSTATSPTYIFKAMGSYNVTLVASDGPDSRLANAIITVAAPRPVVSFTANKSSGRAPLSVSFSSKSSNASSFLWSFGDGSAGSIEASPTHTFKKAGTFTVTLTATGPGGTATASRTIKVSRPLPDLALSLSRKASKLQSGYRFSSFVVKLRNRGAAADGRVKITITLPAGSSFASISSRGRKCARTRRRAVCSFRTLAAGRSAKLSFVARVTKRATVKATAAGKSTEISLANNAARVETR